MAETLKKPQRAKGEEENTTLNLDNLFEEKTPTDDDTSLDNLMAEFSAQESAEVKVNRVLPNNKLSYIYSCHPNEFRFDDLRDQYDGGKFRIFLFGVDEGRKVLKSVKQFEIEKPKPKIETIQPQQNNTDILQLMQGMMQGFQELGKLIVSTSQQNQPHISPEEMRKNMLSEMVLMKQVFGGNETQRENPDLVAKSLEMLTKGIEMGKSLSPSPMGEASATDVLLETVKGFAPMLAAGLAQNNQQQSQRPQMQQPALAPVIPFVPLVAPATENQTSINNNPEPQPESADMNFIKKAQLKMGLNFLVGKAKENADPILYAQLCSDNLNDEDFTQIITMENPLDFFTNIEPEVNNHKDWFLAIVNELKNMFTDDGEITENSENTIEGTTANAIGSNDVTSNAS